MATAEDGKLSEETARERLPPGFNSISELECPLCCESYSAQDTLRFPYQLHCRHVPGCATCLGALLVGSGAAKCIRCPVCRKNTSVQRVENLIVCEAIRSLLRAVASAATEERGATQTGFTVFVTPLQGGTIVFNEITSETTVEDFFQQVSDRTGTPKSEMRTTFAGKCISYPAHAARKLVADYGIGSGSVLNLLLRLRGGRGPFEITL